MARFKVSAIIDGDTFEVSGGWKWNGETGTRVRPANYDAPELDTRTGLQAKEDLSKLILGEQVELDSVQTIDHGCLVCDVFYDGHKLADYFMTYRT